MRWEKDSFSFYVDGWLVATYKKNKIDFEKYGESYWPFDNRFYLIINLAVGGLLGGPIVNTEKMPFVMEIDYVRVYKKNRND